MVQAIVDLVLKWDLKPERGPLTVQLADLIRDCIRCNELRCGDRIPPTRKLATDLNVSRGTVSTAVELLIAEGLLESRIGSGVYVSPDAQWIREDSPKLSEAFIALPPEFPYPDIDGTEICKIDFRPCRPSLEAFPLSDWKRCIASVSGAVPLADYGDSRGDSRLRESIASYLRRARGLNASSDQIMITNGAVHAMHLMSLLYLDNTSQVIIEDPGYPLARQTFELAGANIIPQPVDEDGIIVEALPKNTKDIRFIYVTPSHQFPTGSRLSLGRRRSLIDWAQNNNVIIIEDDYDGEFRFDVPPLAPLAAMSNNCVVYCGTFSKTMFPGLRIGYAVAPKPLIDALARYRLIAEYAPNTIIQAGLSRFINDGHFEKHILRMRRIYANKRKVLSKSLELALPTAKLSGLESGLHAVVELGEGMSAQTLFERAKVKGILVPPIQRYGYKDNLHHNALVLGYAAPTNQQIQDGINVIASL